MLETGVIQPGVYSFKKINALQAARLAYKLELSEQQTAEEKTSKTTAFKKALKAFYHRQVTIPNYDASESGLHPPEIEHLIKQYTSKNICKRQLTPFELPADWQWSIGRSKQLTRHVVVRHWGNPNKAHSNVHTALSMTDEDAGFDQYAALVPTQSEPWKESKNIVKQKLAKYRGYFRKIRAGTIESYHRDKRVYVSEKIKPKLRESDYSFVWNLFKATPFREFRRVVKRDYRQFKSKNSYSIRSLASFASTVYSHAKTVSEKYKPTRPLAAQKKNSTSGLWERKAQKVYIPCQGHCYIRDTSKQRFIMFGLNLEEMVDSWNEFTQSENNPDYYYKGLSKYNQCSGASLKLLKKGGCDLYLPVRPILYTDQTMVEKYSFKLQKKLDSLNEKADALLNRLHSIPGDSELYGSWEAAQLLHQHAQRGYSRRFRKQLKELATLSEQFSQMSPTTDTLTPMAIRFVNALEQAFNTAGDKDEWLDALTPALSTFSNIREAMIESFEQETQERQEKQK